MRITSKILTLAVVALAATLASSSANAADEDGYTTIFNGKDLTGWTQRNGTATYKVVDGAVLGETTKGSPNSFLCTDKLYGNFDLMFEVKLEDNGLNSGVQIRSNTKGGPKGRVNGPQVEIEATGSKGAESGYIYGEAAGGWMTPNADRKPHKHFKDGEWNQYRVVADGANIKTWINGELISDLTDEAKLKSHPEGFIGLQVHGVGGDPHWKVQWRNIKIKEL